MPWIIPAITVSYLLGAIPTAYIFGRCLKGIDIRKFGSGNIGATNALRVLGKKVGALVLLIDMLKGLLPVVIFGDYLLARGIDIPAPTLRILLGLSCILGHIWTVFLKFKGGKGIATTFGVLIGLAMRVNGLNIVLLLMVLTWLVVFLIFRIVSISSVVAGIALPIYMFLFNRSAVLVVASALLAIIAIFRHQSNLKRFFRGEEPVLSFKKSA